MPKYNGQAEQVILSLYAIRNIVGVGVCEILPVLKAVRKETNKAINAFKAMMENNMFEVTISSSDGKKRYTETIDPKSDEWGDYFDDKDSEYTRTLSRFSHRDIGQYNEGAGHFIFGWMESFVQSDEVPMWMRESSELFIEFRPI